MKVIILTLLLFHGISYADDSRYKETRCCVEIQRDASGNIKRDGSVKREFRKRWPCPTGAGLYEPCPGWHIDHTIPLACGGVDAVGNLQWLPVEIKACAGTKCKDRFERKVYCQ